MLQREQITGALRDALQPQDFALALCEGGAAAFSRVDEWSDIDLNCIVRDDTVDAAFAVVEDTLARLGTPEIVYTIPQPTWHGHAQKFYRIAEAGPFRLIDLTIIRECAPNKFLEREVHGSPVVHFDKADIVGSIPAADRDAHVRLLLGRVQTLRTTFDLFQCLPLKEAHRNNAVEALAFYHGFTLAPLVELLRIRYAPFHFQFRTRYLHYDLPGDIAARLQSLYFVADLDDLRRKHDEAQQWFLSLMEETTPELIETAVRVA